MLTGGKKIWLLVNAVLAMEGFSRLREDAYGVEDVETKVAVVLLVPGIAPTDDCDQLEPRRRGQPRRGVTHEHVLDIDDH